MKYIISNFKLNRVLNKTTTLGFYNIIAASIKFK